MHDVKYNRSLHWLAFATAAATFPLIFMGGLVTSHGAGMSVPDWPNSYGYNMFLFPPRLWIGGILYEHTHRLMGPVVGMLAIALTLVAWRSALPRWIKWLCTTVLAAVIVLGVLGGMRVVLVKLGLAIVHACFAQAFFCLAAFTALATSKWWNAPREEFAGTGRGLIAACVVAVVLIYSQTIAGALMRHNGAGLAVPDFPLAYGQVLPATDSASLAEINQQRAWKLNLPAVTSSQLWLHMSHRIGAALVSVAILVLAGIAIVRYRGQRMIFAPAMMLIALLAAQIALGAYTVLKRKPADIASLHVAVGALTLMTVFVMTAAAVRLFATPQAAEDANGRFPVSVLRARLAAA